MANKLSFTQINTFTTCGRKYELHYLQRKRSKYFHGALAYGSAIDNALNVLLETRDLQKAQMQFHKYWESQYINNVKTYLCKSPLLVYADADFDADLLLPSDLEILKLQLAELNLGNDPIEAVKKVKEYKKEVGYRGLSEHVLCFYNHANWISMSRKGMIMLESYNQKIMPRIKEVLAVQHKTELVNSVGDAVTQVLDIIIKWEDDKIYLMDNKTSAREYESDSASMSQQLISYFFKSKEEFKLDAIGFFVLNKNILKNKVKTCTTCGKVAESNRVQKCAYETEPGNKKTRCNGEFNEVIDPECYIQVIMNEVTEAAQDLVLSTFDEANHGITNQMYYKNLAACRQGSITCPFIEYCWKGDESHLITVENRKDT